MPLNSEVFKLTHDDMLRLQDAARNNVLNATIDTNQGVMELYFQHCQGRGLPFITSTLHTQQRTCFVMLNTSLMCPPATEEQLQSLRDVLDCFSEVYQVGPQGLGVFVSSDTTPQLVADILFVLGAIPSGFIENAENAAVNTLLDGLFNA